MTNHRKRVLVIGGGAAGMAAACFAARNGASAWILEKNEKLGKKIYITGKGRCNVTNTGDLRDFMDHMVSNPRFLYSALSRFDCRDLMELIENSGTPLKTERGGRVFPVSDHASDITKAWKHALDQAGVHVRLNTEVKEILHNENGVYGVRLTDGSTMEADAVIVASGGLSYPSTGSTGDGYRFAEECGHTLQARRPSLVPLTVKEEYIHELEGLSLRNVTLTVRRGRRELFSEFGELLFTRDGISGPLGLTVSAKLGKALEEGPLSAAIDLKPALSDEQLDARLLREFSAAPNKTLKNVMRTLLPTSLCPVALSLLSFSGERPVNAVTREERKQIRDLIRSFPLTLTGTHGFTEAVVTQGGITVREIDPGTMESKRCPRLYFAGEVLDLDAMTGGYNLQIAWTTGVCAGTAAASYMS